METKENIVLKSLRISKGYTILEMAQLLHVSKSFYWQIEHSNRRLTYSFAKQVAEIFSLKPDDIFYNVETK